jgi:four helix bundle protein
MSAENRKPGEPEAARVRLVGTADDLRDGQPATHEPATPERIQGPTIHDPTAHVHAHEHEHEHAHERAPLASGSFPHEKLDAYHVAVEMAVLANTLAERIPRGHRNIADHMLRAASNTVLLLAEGANRRGAGQKRQRFVESRGECGEVAAAADLLLAYDIASRPDTEQLRRLSARVGAMLTRLIARLDE